jgi:hypothetical protein
MVVGAAVYVATVRGIVSLTNKEIPPTLTESLGNAE